MSVKKYGIYLAFPPTVDIRAEGLGRYIAAFLKASQNEHKAHFLIGCPSWSRDSLILLCKGEGINFDTLEFLSPRGTPALLRFFYLLKYVRDSKVRCVISRLHTFFRFKQSGSAPKTGWALLKWVVSSPSVLAFITLALLGALAAPIIITFALIGFGIRFIATAKPHLMMKLNKLETLNNIRHRLAYLSRNVKNYDIALFLYRIIQEDQAKKLITLINKRTDISAWYAPTAFWDEFGWINAPKLMCVPDIVLKDFPVGFSGVGGNRISDSYKRIEKAVLSVDNLVTYSEYTKFQHIIKNYSKNPSSVFVVPHAPNKLNQWLTSACDDLAYKKASTEIRNLVLSALALASNRNYAEGISSPDFSFLFYASQIRPNKNVMTLLRAYEYLLRHDYIPHKLIMTGNPHSIPAVARFIEEHQLQKDVLFLHGLSTSQLAACYAMADLAVNPSLSEGGCPFTFTEALSVGTPAVMARIPVALEVLQDENLQEATFFDPYDWKDLVKRIKWALANREQLLSIQKPVYEELTKRTWQDVVNDHIDILEKIANQNADQSTERLRASKSA